MEQPPQQPPEQPPQPQPWGGQPWSRPQPPREPAPPRGWGDPPVSRQQWGYRPPPGKAGRPPGPPPWYRHPVGMLLIGAAVVILLALVVPAFTGGGGTDPAPTVTTGAFGAPGTTAPPPATTSGGQPPTVAEQLRESAQDELGEAGEVASVTAPPGGQVTVTWDIRRAGSQGLTENNARFGVMRIMRAIQQSQLTAGGDPPRVRLLGRYQLAGAATPVTVVRLRFDRSTVERGEFQDRRYLEAFELADAARIHPAFRG